MWPGGSALSSLWGITVRLIYVSLGALTQRGMRRILQGVETEPYRRPVWLYGLYGIHVATATNLKQDTSLPFLSPTLSRNYEQIQVETAGIGERWPLQMPLSYIIYCEGVRGLVLINFQHWMFTFYSTVICTLLWPAFFITYFFIFHSNPFLVLRFSGFSYTLTLAR